MMSNGNEIVYFSLNGVVKIINCNIIFLLGSNLSNITYDFQNVSVYLVGMNYEHKYY